MKVLFVDSEPLARKELQNIIPWSSFGFSFFFEADNGTDALNLMKLENPELVLLDTRLKDMSGMALIREAKENDYACRIIIVSEEAQFTNAKLAINYGVTAYLNKPADPEELTEAVQRAVDEIYRMKLLSIYYEQSAMLSKNTLLSNLLLGSMTYVEEMEPIYHISLNSEYYRIISFHLPDKNDRKNIWKEALQLTKSCLSATFSGTELVFIASSFNQEQFILRQLKTCQEEYPQYVSLLGIISSRAASHTELSTLYSEIQRIYDNLYYYK